MIPLLAKSDVTKKAALLIGGVVVFGIGYFLISRKMQKAKEQKNYQEMEMQVGVNTPAGKAVGYATLLFSAMDGWGTNEELINDTVKKMKANKILFADVANSYRKLYNKNLINDLQKELSAKEYVQFQEIV